MLFCPAYGTHVDASLLHQGATSRGIEQTSTLSASVGRECSELMVGKTVYPFRQRLQEQPGPGIYSLDGFWPLVVGLGPTMPQARQDFNYRFHDLFQTIAAKQDFDRTEEESRIWDRIAMLVDLPRYDQLRTLTYTEMGHIEADRLPGERTVRWHTGRKERVNVASAPGEFAALPLGRWFQAVVRREFLTGRLVGVEHLSPTSAPHFSPAERADFWSRGGDAA
jgi:hypothetical protein